MRDSLLTLEVAQHNRRSPSGVAPASLRRLERAIFLSQGEFSLILVCCDYPSLREQILEHLGELFSGKIHHMIVPPSGQKFYTNIQKTLPIVPPQALMVLGLEAVEDIEIVLSSTNLVRNQFGKCFSFPLVLWVNDEIIAKLVRFAPDFKSWAASTIRFSPQDFLGMGDRDRMVRL